MKILVDPRPIRLRHAKHYTQSMQHAHSLYKKGNEKILEALNLFDSERSNIDVVWNWIFSQEPTNETDNILLNLAEAVAEIGKLRYSLQRERIPQLDAQLAASQRQNRRDIEANTLGSLGLVHATLGNYSVAVNYYEQCIDIARSLDMKHLESISLGNLGNVYYFLGRSDFAVRYYEQNLSLAREIGDRRSEGAAIGNLGNIYIDGGDVIRAIENFEQYISISRETGDMLGESIALGSLGLANITLGDARHAINLFEQQLRIRRQLGDQHGEGLALYNMGVAYAALGDTSRAIDFYEQYLVIAEEVGDRRSAAAAMGGLGLAYADLGQLDRSIAYYDQQLVLIRAIGDRRSEGVALGNLGAAYASLDRAKDAVSLYEQALSISRAIGDRRMEAQFQERLGSTYIALNNSQEAIVIYNQALQIYRRNRDLPKVAETLYVLGGLEKEYHHLDVARQLWGESRDIYHQLKHPFEENLSTLLSKLQVGLIEVTSPYIFTAPIKANALIGRDNLFRYISSLWSRPGPRNSLLIYGHRRMGKTSLAQAIAQRCELSVNNTTSIYLSLEMVDLDCEGGLYLSLALHLWMRFKKILEKPDENEYNGSRSRTYFDLFLENLADVINDGQVVIVLDEFEILYERLPHQAHSMIMYLRALTQAHTWFALALVGLSDLEDLCLSYGSSLLGWAGIRVSFLDEEGVRNILDSPPNAPDFPLSYTSEAIRAIWQKTNGQPYLTQVIGHRLVQHYNRLIFNESFSHNGVFLVDDVDRVLDDAEFYSTTAAYFKGVWGQAIKGQPGEVSILSALADYEHGIDELSLLIRMSIDSDIFRHSLDALLRHDILCYKGDYLIYTVPLMRDWVQKNFPWNMRQASNAKGGGDE